MASTRQTVSRFRWVRRPRVRAPVRDCEPEHEPECEREREVRTWVRMERSDWSEENSYACPSFERSCYFSKFYTSRVISRRDPGVLDNRRTSRADRSVINVTRCWNISENEAKSSKIKIYVNTCIWSHSLNSVHFKFQIYLLQSITFRWCASIRESSLDQ